MTELRARVAPVSAAMMLGALVRTLSALEPERDWGPLARVYNHLRQTAAPSRDKLSCLVPASDLFELGISLMESCEEAARPGYVATRYRDGLITAAETKSGRPYVAGVPSELTPCIDDWLQVHRASLQLIAARNGQGGVGDHLWFDRSGRPMRSATIREQINIRTRHAFGRHVWPHLFRDCAVTELVDCAPKEIGIAPDLLGHADLRTTRKYYIQATGVTTHVRVQQMIAQRRAAASRDA